ncbi:5-formyltetrahydrofolate cyclo-ligase [Melissospora conviva]|uniref:5-formyltetrahydrofolate cyclo-ligase n=1 Tax=Melissospora conviva TaxID=3388432 RepID=UPI003C1DAA5A
MMDFSDAAQADRLTKRDLRAELLARRRQLTPAERERAAARVQATLTALLTRLRPVRISAYVPVGSEPGGPSLPAVLASAAPSAQLLLPVLCDDLDLDWAAYDGAQPLVAAGRGLREPPGPRLGRAAVADAELVIVPALAVDRRGLRLGRGGGSYDRALARVGADTCVVALLHDGELLPRVPAEPHDRPVRAAVTPGDGLVPFPA